MVRKGFPRPKKKNHTTGLVEASLMGKLASRLRQVSLVSAVQGPAQDD